MTPFRTCREMSINFNQVTPAKQLLFRPGNYRYQLWGPQYPRGIHLFAGRAVKRERRKGSSRRQQPAYGAAVNEVARELLRSARSPKRENGDRRYIKHDGMIASPVGSCLCCGQLPLSSSFSGSVFWFCYYSPVVELLVLLLCILTCKQVFSSSSIQGHLPWLRCSFDLVVHRPHRHHPFSLALRRPLRLATSQPRSGLGV